MFQTSSCDRKLPTHSECHTEFWADFPFLFPFSPLSNFFSSKSIQKLLPKLSSSIVVLMTSFSSLNHPCLMVKVCLHCLGLPLCLPLLYFPLIPCFFSPSATQDCHFWCPSVWNIYSSVLQIKRVFPFLYPRLPRVSSKPTSCTYIFIALEHIKHLLQAWHCSG